MPNYVEYAQHAEVAELADALRSGRSDLYGRVGSTPTFGTLTLIDGISSQRVSGPYVAVRSDVCSPTNLELQTRQEQEQIIVLVVCRLHGQVCQ